MRLIHVDNIDDERIAAYTNLTELQLRNRLGMFAAGRCALGQHHVQPGGNLIDQQVARALREFLQGIGIHQTITFLPAPISASRVFFIASR